MKAPTDVTNDLLVAVAAGDVRAFRRLYEASSPYLLGILISKLGNRDVAEETLQECYVKIWQSAASFDPARGQAMAWLSTVVRNKAVDVIRGRRPDESGLDWESELDGWADATANPHRDAELSQQIHLVGAALTRLPPQMRRSVLMNHHEGRSHEEIAQLMRVPLGTVKSWVRRGVEQIRQQVPLHNEAV